MCPHYRYQRPLKAAPWCLCRISRHQKDSENSRVEPTVTPCDCLYVMGGSKMKKMGVAFPSASRSDFVMIERSPNPAQIETASLIFVTTGHAPRIGHPIIAALFCHENK